MRDEPQPTPVWKLLPEEVEVGLGDHTIHYPTQPVKSSVKKLPRGLQCLPLAVPSLNVHHWYQRQAFVFLPFYQLCRLHKTSFVPDLASRVYYVLVSSEGILTERAHHPWVQPWLHRRRLGSCLSRCYNCPGFPWFFREGGGYITQSSAWPIQVQCSLSQSHHK